MKQLVRRNRIMFRTVAVLLAAGVGIFAWTRINEAQTTEAPPEGRSPIVTNQFNANSGAALQDRAPGRQVQQGLAAAQGTSQFIVGDDMDDADFLPDTISMIILEIIDQISQILSGLNLLAGGNPLSGLLGGSGTGGLGSLFGTLTGGSGSIPIS